MQVTYTKRTIHTPSAMPLGSARVRGTRLITQIGAWMYHFDETGRLLLAVGPHQVVRRGLDNRLLRVTTPGGSPDTMVTGNTVDGARSDTAATAVDSSRRQAAPTDATGANASYAPGQATDATNPAAASPAGGGLVYRTYQTLEGADKVAFYHDVYASALAALADDPSGATATTAATAHAALTDTQRHTWARLLAAWSPAVLATDEAAFASVYSPISILPPDQYHALVVQVTLGCSYNRCLFCDFYRDRRFHIRSEAELEHHLDGLMDFLGPRAPDRKSVFLADGNAFVVPTARLLQMITQIKRRLPPDADVDFNAFMDTFTLEHKQVSDLRRIYDAGLHTVYTGLETGSNRMRAFLHKPGTAVEAVDALNTLKAAGFRLGVIMLVGVGGPAAADEHLRDSIVALQRINFTPGDVIYLSPFVDPDDTGYPQALAEASLDAFSQAGLAAELARWRNALAALRDTLPAKVTLYSILEHIYS